MSDFLNKVMDPNESVTLTICGSARFRSKKEKYQAYYTAVYNNLVFMPINFKSVEDELKTTISIDRYINNLHNIHDKKIDLSDAIIIVNENHVGKDTLRELIYAYNNNKIILFTHVPDNDKDKFYFNHDLNYPLYMAKEEK